MESKIIRILIIKTSSLGDIIHTLPALTDAMNAIQGIRFDWVIEERFQIVPTWHPAIDHVFPIALRRWKKKKNLFHAIANIRKFKKAINEHAYDLIIDAQGLIKSAAITALVRGTSVGYEKNSSREKLAAIFYDKTYQVNKQQHAIERIRDLFSQALYYPRPNTTPKYGIHRTNWISEQTTPYILLFHGTTWPNKHWPEGYWKELIRLLNQQGLKAILSWGNEAEYKRSLRLAKDANADVLPDLNIEGLMPVIANAKAVIAVDTGLCHLAAALTIPTIALFGPTDPEKTGLMGHKQLNLTANFQCAPCVKRQCIYTTTSEDWPPCFRTLPPILVLQHLTNLLLAE